MSFQPDAGGPGCVKFEQTLAHAPLEPDSDRTHIAHDLAWGFFEGEIQAFFSPRAGRFSKLRGQAGLAGSRFSRNENAAAAEESLAVRHLIQGGNSCRNALF